MSTPAAASDAKEAKTAKSYTGIAVAQKRSLTWLGITMFGLLMLYPFVAQYVPSGIREFLSASLR